MSAPGLVDRHVEGEGPVAAIEGPAEPLAPCLERRQTSASSGRGSLRLLQGVVSHRLEVRTGVHRGDDLAP
jgi:hypothetical protein